MFTRLLQALAAPKPTPLPEPDEALALGALMVRIAKSDNDYDVSEIRRIDRLLSRLHGLGPVDAARMRASCEKLEHAAPDSDPFGHLIRETVPYDRRLAALAALWEVVLSDGAALSPELRVLDTARAEMGLNEEDSAAARAQAEGARDTR
jgi:uncharacterized tellurite resistance protein B-like protein